MSADTDTRQVDALADRYVTECVERYPDVATELGVEGFDHLWRDLSPAGQEAQLDHLRSTLAELAPLLPVDDRERTAKEAMQERLGLEVELHEAHLVGSQVSVIAGAAQSVRGILDLMPTDGEQAWRNIIERLATIDQPLGGARQTLTAEAEQNYVSAVRQVAATIDQIKQWTGQTGQHDFFAELADRAPADLSPAARADLEVAADHARRSFGAFGDWLGSDLAPLARRQDAVGAEPYALCSRNFLGASIDLEETYQWGFTELSRIQTEQRAIASQLFGSDNVPAAYAALDEDPARQIVGAEAFRDWMQQLADTAVAELAGVHFDIPNPIRRIDACLAPTHDGIIYYTPPAEDFSRPGQMWWSVPDGIDSFSTWREVTTIYHEGVPGHHLQVAQNAYRADLLNRWQRLLCFVSGHGEGWALYAERLMEELGYLDDPADKLGMLDAHAFRATRVIIDIGMHLQLEIPADNPWGFHPGERWTPDYGFEFLRANTALDEPTLRYELNRYLGWPGQAPSYKVGERIWLEARADARHRKGDAFDLRQFHSDALNLGPLGLDPLRDALARL